MSDETDLTFTEMMDAAEEKIEDEMEEYDFDVPNHAGRLLINAVSDLNATLIDLEIIEQMEEEELTDEEISEALAVDAVEIVLSLAALRYEYDLDIESAYEDRMEIMEAVQNAESHEELMEAMMGEEMMEQMGVEIGDNVDREGYDSEGVNRSFA